MRDQLPVHAFRDARYDSGLIDGILGLDFFRPFDVWERRDHTHTFYLVPRADFRDLGGDSPVTLGRADRDLRTSGCGPRTSSIPRSVLLEDGAQHPALSCR